MSSAFEKMVAHLHDVHGLNAEAMAEDERGNGTDPEIIEWISNMSREQALERLPYHYFMDTRVSRDDPAALASARITHNDECVSLGVECDFDV